jgi:membrane protease YdiL (CAAX protease family)
MAPYPGRPDRGKSLLRLTPERRVPYWRATRHPWPCLLFLLPLLAAYEGGVVWVGGSHADDLRNGADAWFRWGLEAFGVGQIYAAPVLIATAFLVGSWFRREDRPGDVFGVCLGMALESVLFGLGLWGVSRLLGPLLDALSMDVSGPASGEEAFAQVVTFVGAGIYEEVLFRLGLYSSLYGLLRLLQTPSLLAMTVAAVFSATVFAAAHHVGPSGEPFDDFVFLFRAVAGLYFAALYQTRGFGVAVGAHACYDVLVGVAVG